MSCIRILIVDDHEVVRRGIRALLETQPGWEVAGEAVSGRQAVEEARRLNPDQVIMDISMPDMNGLAATRQIRKENPNAEVLILSVHESELLVREVLEAGARGYVLKTDAGRDLIAAVETLSQHKPFFTAKISEIMLDAFRKPGGTSDPNKASLGSLTVRERQVTQLLADGKSNKEIADLLAISVKTVETHRSHVMTKLNLHSMSDLVRYAVRNQMIQPWHLYERRLFLKSTD